MEVDGARCLHETNKVSRFCSGQQPFAHLGTPHICETWWQDSCVKKRKEAINLPESWMF